MPREPPESFGNDFREHDRAMANSLDLNVVDEAFGEYADLYSDVLQVSSRATPEQIQLAYFDRRSELFNILSKLDGLPQDEGTEKERMEAERKMDSVVLAVRVLGDPEHRLEYDQTRQERLINRRRADHGQLPGHTARVGSLDAGGDNIEPEAISPSKKHKSKRKSKERKKEQKSKHNSSSQQEMPAQEAAGGTYEEPDDAVNRSSLTQDTEQDLTDEEGTLEDPRNMSLDTYDTRQDDGDTTYYSMSSKDVSKKDEGYLSFISNSRVLRKISDEISGACEDTLVSVDQVFNAFTLTDKDIRAVTKRIDKAKRQFDN